jgi:SAM-dependent methyltransferase
MFICPSCKNQYTLPICPICGYAPAVLNDVWQLTDAPDIVIDGEGDKYIGYEYIGENYSGNRKYVLEYPNVLFAKEISRLTGDGIFLDLGCGDGCFTVPAAQNGTKVIAADISNNMLQILKQKASHNNISLENVIMCRMNALNIDLADNTVDSVVSNSVLHLISRPDKVISEIYRVLKPNGSFIFKDDRPGVKRDTPFDNSKYNNIVNELYSLYWNLLAEHDVRPKKYSWKFDREAICGGLFNSKEEIIIPVQIEYSNKLKDGFLPRFLGRGFSDQVDVPANLHNEILAAAVEQIKQKHGENFDETAFYGIEPDIVMTVYRK